MKCNIYSDMDKPWKYYANWKKPVRKDHVLEWFYLYEMSWIGKFSVEMESRFVVAQDSEHWTATGYGLFVFFNEMIEMFQKQILGCCLNMNILELLNYVL